MFCLTENTLETTCNWRQVEFEWEWWYVRYTVSASGVSRVCRIQVHYACCLYEEMLGDWTRRWGMYIHMVCLLVNDELKTPHTVPFSMLV